MLSPAPATDLRGCSMAKLFAPAGTVDLGEDADNVRVDASTGNILVGYGSGGIAVVDPRRPSVINKTELPAHPEGFQLDPASPRAFVNLPDARQIGVVDIAANMQVASWRAPNLHANFPMAIDDQGAVIATVFRGEARLALLQTDNGAISFNLQTCDDADDIFFDSARRRIYVSCGEGLVDVLQQGSTGYQRLGPNQDSYRGKNLTVRAPVGSPFCRGARRILWVWLGRRDSCL